MKKHFYIKEGNLWKNYKLNHLAKSASDYDDLEEESLDDSWRKRAKRMQIRRWRKIKHQLV